MEKRDTLGKRDSLQPERIRARLGPSIFSQHIIFHESLNSTNTLAKDLALQGAPEGTVVLAEEQTAGRGRMDRQWLSPPKANLLVSLLLRPPIAPQQVFSLTMIMALAAIDGVRALSGLNPGIKWPNDLYLQDKKLGGILTEFSARAKEVEYVVLGLGLNVNWSPEEGEIAAAATSIRAETGLRVCRNDLLVGILRSFETYYQGVLVGDVEGLYRRWNGLSILRGKFVEMKGDKERQRGRVLRTDRDGGLLIQDEQGRVRKILSGDVSLSVRPNSKRGGVRE